MGLPGARGSGAATAVYDREAGELPLRPAALGADAPVIGAALAAVR